MRHLVNCLTAARIVLAVCLLRTEAGSPAFFTLYTAAGLTDLLDGPLARRTGSQSAFGARLDSAADLVFFAAASVCLLPRLWRLLPPAVWLGTLVTAAGRGTAFSLCLRHHGCIPALHTRLNKLTGAGLFCLPYVWRAGIWRRMPQRCACWRWRPRRRTCGWCAGENARWKR